MPHKYFTAYFILILFLCPATGKGAAYFSSVIEQDSFVLMNIKNGHVISVRTGQPIKIWRASVAMKAVFRKIQQDTLYLQVSAQTVKIHKNDIAKIKVITPSAYRRLLGGISLSLGITNLFNGTSAAVISIAGIAGGSIGAALLLLAPVMVLAGLLFIALGIRLRGRTHRLGKRWRIFT